MATPFEAAGTPGRGSTVGDFVPGKNGGWVPKDHPDAIGNENVNGGPDVGVAGEAGPGGAAMSGLQNAASGGNSGSAVGVRELAPPGAGNPNLGQRIYPVAMRQLSMLPRIY